MGKLDLGFRPVKVKIGNEILESEFSQFYRTFALFESCYETENEHFDSQSQIYRLMKKRIIDLGNSGSVMPQVQRSNPFQYDDNDEFTHDKIVVAEFFVKDQ